MANALIISIDSSTTACKAIAWDRQGRAVAEERATYPLLQPHPTWAEQNAEHWWSSLSSALRACVAQVDGRPIAALGITHQRETFVPVDRECRPIRNAILWSDERSRVQVQQLAARLGRDHLHQLTGKPPAMTPSLYKIAWLQEHEPNVLPQAHRILDVHAFLVRRLTGQNRTSLACADPMGLVDMQQHGWARDLILDLGLHPDQFPELVEPGAIIGQITPAAASATGLPAGLPVVAGAGDGQCAGLGANATGSGRAYLNLGTAVVSGVLSSQYQADRAFRTLYAPLSGAYFLEHVLRGGVFTIAWFVEKFATDLRNPLLTPSPEEILEAAAAQIPAGAAGLLVVPYWNNVMNPYWDPTATGITIGWSGAHGREHFYRAILEGIAYEQRLVGDAMMAATGQRFSEYVTMGGGSRSPLWCQIIADVTGVPVVRSLTTEATCLGAAILAAAAVGWYPTAQAAANAMCAFGARFEPNPTTQAVYQQIYQEIYQPLFPTLQRLSNRLTTLTHGAS
jgi:sugar (pentulose or hexulose) kinase